MLTFLHCLKCSNAVPSCTALFPGIAFQSLKGADDAENIGYIIVSRLLPWVVSKVLEGLVEFGTAFAWGLG